MTFEAVHFVTDTRLIPCNYSNFHTRCDFKGPTVTIVRTPDAVFGGYSALPWAPNGGYK